MATIEMKMQELLPAIPLVSVITVVFNGEAHLQEAIDSIRLQTYGRIEYILIDGGSKDRTLHIVDKNRDIITRWISEPDNGIYDAMNKGIRMASGTYIGMLNADDVLLPDSIERVVTALKTLSEPGYTCCAIELISESGLTYGSCTPLSTAIRYRRRFLEMPCPHLGVFVHRALYENFGLFDTRFKIRADYDFILRMMSKNIPAVDLLVPIGRFRAGGVSGGLGTWIETFGVHRKHGVSIIFSTYSVVRSAIRSSAFRCLPRSIVKILNRRITSTNRYL